ncbi:mitochondrial protein C2orf69 homolog isoform X2 [Lycorma delicatula]|uniref:mitochondrial protein C2orf69 homolog isoform X2 n=1 Tax=Lycorma delicatula TaxID=130591 RepID=UPI003F50F735
MMDHTYVSDLHDCKKILGRKGSSVTTTTDPSLSCLTLQGVYGFDNRKNDIIYCQPVEGLSQKSVVVFFGGDIQDFLESMEKNKDSGSHEYLKWNLESTAHLMHTFFPDKHVIVVRPSRMDFNTYSCFENFVPVIKYGTPKHRPMHNALQHLEKLLEEVTLKIRQLPNMVAEGVADLHKSELSLIGFSKGCVVLNQFLYEFHYMKTLAPDDESMSRIVSRISEMYWLDGGHSGGKNTWITSRCLLETLAGLGIKIHVHVTPYQICDDKRPWIAVEEKQFSGLLQEMGADIKRVIHFEDDHFINLITHFELLSVFKQTPASVETNTN